MECDMETKECFLCQNPCSSVCPHCRLVYYCSEDHFKLHRVTLNSDDEVIKTRFGKYCQYFMILAMYLPISVFYFCGTLNL